jgi:dTDP-glucose pyrophosphorylase
MKNWETVLISPQSTLLDAMAALDRGGLQIAVVVNEKRRVLGTLTDGDIRRALLRQLPMSTPARDIMGRYPETAPASASKEEVLARMERRRLLQIPIVDEQDRIVSLQTLQDLLQPKHRENSVLLMAGGFGKRLHPLTDNCPKPMLNVGDKPILEIIIENFVAAGFYRFFISTHYRSEMIRERIGDGRRWNIEVKYVHEDQPLGTGGALGLLPKTQIRESMIVMNGDLLTNLDFNKLLDFHDEHDGVATMCVREYKHCVPYGVIESDGLSVTSMVEKPEYLYFINAGIYVLAPSVLDTVVENQRIDMPALLEQRLKVGERVNIFPVHEYWLDIGSLEDFRRAQAQAAGVVGG